jgi:hypothetical protein
MKAKKCRSLTSSIRSILLELEQSKLESLAKLTSNSELSQHVQNLTITRRAYHGSDYRTANADRQAVVALAEQHAGDLQRHRAGLDIQWLTKIFANLASRAHRELESLSVVAVVYVNDTIEAVEPWKSRIAATNLARIWSQTFSCTMKAPDRAHLPIRSLDLFKSNPAGRKCGLPSRSLDCRQWTRNGAHALVNLRCLSIPVLERTLLTPSPFDFGRSGVGPLHESVVRSSRRPASIAGLIV